MPRSPSRLSTAIALALGAGLVGPSAAQPFPAELDLADLDGTNGFVLNGDAANDVSGWSASAAGDVNGDGIDDLIIGAHQADPDGIDRAGRSYVVFGTDSGIGSIELSSLNGVNGFQLNGGMPLDRSGYSVSTAGDVDGDGFDDLIIGAYGAGTNGTPDAGRSYVIFGTDSGVPSIQLSSLNGVNGFAVNGETAYDYSGWSVSTGGDVNGDGFDDLIIGAVGANPNGIRSGRSYVVFGGDSNTPSVDLSSLNGVNGFKLNGEAAFDDSGFSVSTTGDVNGDGFDDLIIGAYDAAPNGYYSSGRSYVVFGTDQIFPGEFDLSGLDGSNGFILDGEEPLDRSGISVSDAGDVNGDGIADLIIGASGFARTNSDRAGRSYVVFGTDLGFPKELDLSSLNGVNGFKLTGGAAPDRTGRSVSAAGDVNGDGIDDLIIGAYRADLDSSERAGRSYVVFGTDRGFPGEFDLGNLDGSNGFKINGETSFDRSGFSVSAAGDVNNDGIDDLIIGAYGAAPNGNSGAGRSYVVFGRAAVDLAVTKTNGAAFVDTGQTTTWTIEVRNASAVNVADAVLIDPVPAGVTDVHWTCTGLEEAACSRPDGDGGIDETVNLPPNGVLRYALTATITAIETETVSNTATIALADGQADTDPSNNSATDTDAVGLFADGFEDETG